MNKKQLEQLLDDNLVYIGALTFISILAFNLGLLIGFIITV